MEASLLGHNSEASEIHIEVRFFNSLSRYHPTKNVPCKVTLPVGTTVGDLLERYGIAEDKVFLVLCNGRDVTPELEGGVRTEYGVEDGDVIALSGPVPYSWGYGAPVV